MKAKEPITEPEAIEGICRGISDLLHMVLVKRATLLMGELHEQLDLRDKALGNPDEVLKRMTAAMREADEAFERVGGNTVAHVRDCLLPVLAKHGLELRLKP